MGSFHLKTYNFLMENLFLPLFDIARGTSRFKCSRILQKTQWYDRRNLERLQKKNLRLLIKHAYDTVPYYNKIFRERGLYPSDIRNVEDLVKLPILTKTAVRKNLRALVSRSYPAKKLIRYTSGGSGDQLRFYITKDQLSWEVAAEYRAYEWAGSRRGDSCFLFWGSPIDMSKRKSIQWQLGMNLERTHIIDTFALSNEALSRSASLLELHNPSVIRGYSSSIYLMAKYLIENGIKSVRPRTVLTTAEALSSHMRETIEEAFSCSVFDFYGSREIGSLAAECKEHSGYHISAENVAIEFVNSGEHVAAGEKGTVLLTSLRNFGMPFIRYQIGDVAVPSGDSCGCGRGLPLMQQIEGRVSDFLALYDNRLDRIIPVGPVYIILNNAMIHVPLQSVRIYQENLNSFLINAVKDKAFSDKDADRLITFLRSYLGQSVNIKIEFADYLPPAPSGKRPTFISKINPFEQSG